jgi:hypothetical protein
MMRHWPAFAAAVAVAAASVPALAQDRPPPPAWSDPQAPEGPLIAGAPFVPPPPGAYPMPGPAPFPPGPMPVPPPGMPTPGLAYQYGATATPCGCGAAAYNYVWVPVQVRTNYLYSPAIQHVREVPEEHVVYSEAVETRTVPVRGKAKYVKVPPRAKLTKSRPARRTK